MLLDEATDDARSAFWGAWRWPNPDGPTNRS